MATKRHSEITPATAAPALADQVVGVRAGAIDTLWSLSQISSAVGGGGGANFNQIIVTGASYTVANDTQRVLVNAAGPVTVTMPLASSMMHEAFAIGVLVKDIGGTAGSGHITIAFTNPETCDGRSSLTISNSYGWIEVSPKPGGGAWYQSR